MKIILIQQEQLEEQIAEPEKVTNLEPISQPKLKKRRPKRKKKIGFFKLFGYFVRLDFGWGIDELKVSDKAQIHLSLATDF